MCVIVSGGVKEWSGVWQNSYHVVYSECQGPACSLHIFLSLARINMGTTWDVETGRLIIQKIIKKSGRF